MAIIIGTVTLDNPMEWTDQFTWTPITGVSARTLDGVAIAQAYSIIGDRPMTLAGGPNRGWQKQSTVNSLVTLASTPGQIITVNYHTTEYLARFSEVEPGPISFAPVTTVDNPDEDFWYTGTIRLFIVSS